MSFRLKEGVYRIRCREPGCPFASDFVVKENLMGATEADVDSEALKIARNLGYIKHDALFGRKHQLANPEVYKVSSTYDRIGTPAAASVPTGGYVPPASPQPGAPTRTYRRGEVIIRKGESAVTICEVIHGSALNEKLPDLSYKIGESFGSAAIFRKKNRMTDIVAGEDGTVVAFYNIRELTKTNPGKARVLYDEAMEDIFHVLGYLEEYSAGLEKKVQTLEAARRAGSKAGPKKATAAKKKALAKKKAPAKKKASKKTVPKKVRK